MQKQIKIKKSKWFIQISFLLIFLFKQSFAGNGTSHPMAGALWAKYLSYHKQGTTYQKIYSYSSAFLLGILSHGAYDYFGNYEPKSGTPEMTYFVVEGIAGMVLLYPHWKKDPRLFWGSMGGLIPDIEHSVHLTNKRIFPTHNGRLPHGERRSFWQGAVENLIFNTLSYYLIIKNLDDNDVESKTIIGARLNLWDGSLIIQNGAAETFTSTSYPFLKEFLIRSSVSENLFIELSTNSWRKNSENKLNKDYPSRIIFNGYLINLIINPYNDYLISPFIGLGMGYFTANKSNAVNDGDISFSHFLEGRIGMTSIVGIDWHLSKSWFF